MYLLEALRNKTLSYSSSDRALIEKAFLLAEDAHKEQKRHSGESYIIHPVAVACILADMKLDAGSVITGLLHDTVEDTQITLDEIKNLFGQEVAHLVKGVTKLSKIELQSDQTQQAENFRKLVLAMSDDIRVLLIKLVDRLHNMRTLYHIKSEKNRRRISLETMEIYAPLAERIGMNAIQEELENLAFAQLNPDAYESIAMRLETIGKEGETQIEQVIEDLKKTLANAAIYADVSGRQKTPYSIWKKMRRKNMSFEQLSDVMAFRVTVNSIADCYQALGAIHHEYLVLPGRFKDYISTPKPNHYQSLHTTVIGPLQRHIEIQIRTYEMHKVAEYGVAAHWEYKQGVHLKEGRQYRWLRSLLDILENATGAEEFLEHTKLEMFHDQVFCFTPHGDLIALPRGATCIDFAYAVHSDVGNRCTGAKINGRLMPLRSELKNGDQVEVITSPNHEPSPTWERFVVTGKARASIRRYIRNKQQSEFLELGQAILKKAFHQEDISLNNKALQGILDDLKCATLEDLFVEVGRGHYTSKDILRKLYPEKYQPLEQGEEERLLHMPSIQKPLKSERESAIAIRGLIPGMAIHYAGCCHPLPGDRIVGVVVTGKGVTIHTLECDTLERYAQTPERLLDVTWDETERDVYVGRIHLILLNKPGTLGKVTSVIGKSHGNIVNLKMIRRSDEFFDIYVDLDVQSVDHLQSIMASLRSLPDVTSIERK
jgi:GTP pyrophosphokinase